MFQIVKKVRVSRIQHTLGFRKALENLFAHLSWRFQLEIIIDQMVLTISAVEISSFASTTTVTAKAI